MVHGKKFIYKKGRKSALLTSEAGASARDVLAYSYSIALKDRKHCKVKHFFLITKQKAKKMMNIVKFFREWSFKF